VLAVVVDKKATAAAVMLQMAKMLATGLQRDLPDEAEEEQHQLGRSQQMIWQPWIA